MTLITRVKLEINFKIYQSTDKSTLVCRGNSRHVTVCHKKKKMTRTAALDNILLSGGSLRRSGGKKNLDLVSLPRPRMDLELTLTINRIIFISHQTSTYNQLLQHMYVRTVVDNLRHA